MDMRQIIASLDPTLLPFAARARISARIWLTYMGLKRLLPMKKRVLRTAAPVRTLWRTD